MKPKHLLKVIFIKQQTHQTPAGHYGHYGAVKHYLPSL